MRTLAAAHVLSAPLVLPTAGHEGFYSMLAFMSIGDILRAFVERAGAVPPDAPLLQRMSALSALGREFCAADIISLHTRDDGDVVYRGATEGITLLELVRAGFLRMPFQRPSLLPRHRVGVFDAVGCITDIVSMSNLVEWVYARVDQLGTLVQRSLMELGLAGSGAPRGAELPAAEEVVTVPTGMPTAHAFATLVHRGVSAVGVVDAASGVMVANLSESDFRAFQPDDFGSLALPVGEFLVHKHNLSVAATDEAAGEAAAADAPHGGAAPGALGIRDPWARALHTAMTAITVRPGDTLFRALETLVGCRVHRLYVVHPQTLVPLAVVSHTDVLGVLMRGHKPSV